MWNCWVLTSGYSFATAANLSSQYGIEIEMPLTCRRGHLAALAGHRKVKGIAHDALASLLGKHGLLDSHLQIRALVDAPSDGGVLTLVVLTDDVIVDVARLAVCERRLEPLEHAHRPQVDVLLERAADGDQQSPERNVVRHTGIADGTRKMASYGRS